MSNETKDAPFSPIRTISREEAESTLALVAAMEGTDGLVISADGELHDEYEVVNFGDVARYADVFETPTPGLSVLFFPLVQPHGVPWLLVNDLGWVLKKSRYEEDLIREADAEGYDVEMVTS